MLSEIDTQPQWLSELASKVDSEPSEAFSVNDPTQDIGEAEKDAEKAQERQIRGCLDGAGVPIEYRGASLEGLGIGRRPDLSGNRGIYIHGQTGCGKSTLAAAILRWWAGENPAKQARWVSAIQFCVRVKSCARASSKETEHDILSSFRGVPLIVIDDLGQERDHDWDRSILQAMIWQAWDWGSKLIVTSQLSIPQMAKEDPALASRIGSLYQKELRGGDLRQKKNTNISK